jgi:hypothetical protein
MRNLSILFAMAAVIIATACSINVKKNEQSQDKNVDINTPFGGIHVNEGADVRDTGLPVYAGARLKKKDDSGDEKSANVNISTSAFGVKVVAVEYESDDAPNKLIAYYKNALKKYGNVLECRAEGQHYTYEGDSDELKCEGDNRGNTVELKVGTKSNQHIVSIKPQGKGSDFALVYVRTRGKDTTI